MMNRYFRSAGYLLPVFIVFTSVALLGARAKPSGSDQYCPTKKQWLMISFNSTHRTEQFSGGENWALSITAWDGTRPDEIVLVGRFSKTTDRAFFNKMFQSSRSSLENTAKQFGFDDWLTIKEEISMLD